MSDLAPATTPETDDAHFLRTQAADLERHWRGESMPPKWAGLVRREIEQLRRIADAIDDAAAQPRPIVELELLSRFRQGLAQARQPGFDAYLAAKRRGAVTTP